MVSKQLHPKMRSTRNLLLLLLASFLLCTAFYFGFRSYNIRKQIEVPQKESTHADLATLDKSSLKEEKVHSLSVIEAPELHQHLSKESSKSETKTEEDNAPLYSEKEIEMERVEGSVFLKTFLKDMSCVMGEIPPYSISCCGKMVFTEDGSDEKQGCLLLDTYNETGSDIPKYRLRFITEGELIIYEEVTGFPKEDNKCYPLNIKPGVDICATLKVLYLDDDVSDDLGYKTCTFMKFGYEHKLPEQLLGYAETVNCNTQKELIDEKFLSSPFSIILRIKLKSPIEVVSKEDNKGSGQTEDKTDKLIDGEDNKPTDKEEHEDTAIPSGDHKEMKVVNEEATDNPEQVENKDTNESEENEESSDKYDSIMTDGFHTLVITIPQTSTDSSLPFESDSFSESLETGKKSSEEPIENLFSTNESYKTRKNPSSGVFDFYDSIVGSIGRFFTMIRRSIGL